MGENCGESAVLASDFVGDVGGGTGDGLGVGGVGADGAVGGCRRRDESNGGQRGADADYPSLAGVAGK